MPGCQQRERGVVVPARRSPGEHDSDGGQRDSGENRGAPLFLVGGDQVHRENNTDKPQDNGEDEDN